MNQINPMTGWNEFTKEMNEFTTRNLEIMNKYYRTAIEQNDGNIAKNVETYFGFLNTNINYLNTLWTSYARDHKDVREKYTENMNTLITNVTKIYRDTVEKATETTTKSNKA